MNQLRWNQTINGYPDVNCKEEEDLNWKEEEDGEK